MGTIGLLNHIRGQACLVKGDNDRSLAFSGYSFFKGRFNEVGKHRVIETLAQIVIKLHPEYFIDRFKFLKAQLIKLLPKFEIILIALLKLGGFSPSRFIKNRIFFSSAKVTNIKLH